MKRKRIDPPYRAYLVSADGTKTPVDAHGIIIELGPGLELELDLAPHPNHSGGLPISAGPQQSLAELEKSDLCSRLAVRPGASNVIHVFVERHPWGPIFGDGQSEDAEPGVRHERMNEIPERLTCQATLEEEPVAGVMIRAGFGVVAKNAYEFIFGPTNHDGCVVISKEDVLTYADAQLNMALMDYVNLRGGFSGDISLTVVGPDGLRDAIKSCELFHSYTWFPERYRDSLERALANPQSKRASEIKVKCLI